MNKEIEKMMPREKNILWTSSKKRDAGYNSCRSETIKLLSDRVATEDETMKATCYYPKLPCKECEDEDRCKKDAQALQSKFVILKKENQ